ncbi:ATP-grasp domain-containing protein [Clostridium perfringens]|uniref:ATP-grasp domain-containing protein n=1 Tax=Clostridium perfringens TaxID=1502 RepID=UPI0018E3FF38|nr:ATP-grasp domain-containing protein [Clostridium perfringens]MBI6027015.1 ATP-grasp domain-containing protein [Clostridium perfringens]
MKKKVLILGVASVQMDAILMLKEMGYETYACAMAKDGPGVDYVDYFSEINILDREKLIEYIEKNGIDLVYSVGSDLAMPIVNYISRKLNMPHFVSEETALICNNKDLMRKTLGNDFEGNVKFQIIENGDEEIKIKFPFILKPADSQGQRGVFLINSLDEYKKNYEISKSYSRSKLVIAEQYISGPELSVNGYIIDGKLMYIIPSDRETWKEYTGLIHKHVVPSKEINKEVQDKIIKVIENACRKLNINNGPVYSQMKLENNSPYIIEITPRLDGCHMWKLLNYYSGVNLLKLTFEHLLSNNISELNKLYDNFSKGYTLEFICQKPNTKADYSAYNEAIRESLESFNYYNYGDNIRPVNGKFDKIGYFIYESF